MSEKARRTYNDRQCDIDRYKAFPKAPWDGECMLYSDACDRYFIGIDDVLDYADDREIPLIEMRLQLTKAVYPTAPNPADYYCDDLPEDGDLPEGVDEAFEALAAALSKCGPLGWYPINKALDLSTIPTEIKDNEVKP